jgi:hypothetical protein
MIPDEVVEGDVIFLANQGDGIYAWGRVLEKSGQALKIGKGAIGNSLVPSGVFDSSEILRGLLDFTAGQFNFLTNSQVKSINIFLSGSKPPSPNNRQFILGDQLTEDEDLHTEFKEVNAKQIPNDAYTMALSFLRQAGGTVFFGIRDSDHSVVGLDIGVTERDRIKRDVESKLAKINPPIEPVSHYTVEFHQVIDRSGQVIPSRYIFELEIKPSAAKSHESEGGKVYVRTYSGKKRLK